MQLTTTRRFSHVGMCIVGQFHPCAEKSLIFVHFGLAADVIIMMLVDMKDVLPNFSTFSVLLFTSIYIIQKFSYNLNRRKIYVFMGDL